MNRKKWTSGWWFARLNFFILLLERREARLYQMLISSEPDNASEAMDKLLYLSAVSLNEGRALSCSEVEVALGTLQPFRQELHHRLFQKAPHSK